MRTVGRAPRHDLVPWILGIHIGKRSVGYAIIESLYKNGKPEAQGCFRVLDALPLPIQVDSRSVCDSIGSALGFYPVSALCLEAPLSPLGEAIADMFSDLGVQVMLSRPGAWRGELSAAGHRRFLMECLRGHPEVDPTKLIEETWIALGLAMACTIHFNVHGHADPPINPSRPARRRRDARRRARHLAEPAVPMSPPPTETDVATHGRSGNRTASGASTARSESPAMSLVQMMSRFHRAGDDIRDWLAEYGQTLVTDRAASAMMEATSALLRTLATELRNWDE